MASGIADYSFEIVPFVSDRADVDVFCPPRSGATHVRTPRGATLRDPRSFTPDGYDACLYHLGNNPHHDFVYRSAKDRPAISVFHDAVLHHLISFLAFEEGRRDFASYEEILIEELGDLGKDVSLFRRLGFHTEFEKFMFPLTGHVARRSKGIVVHSNDALQRLREVAPEVPMTVIPHHAGEAPAQVEGVTREEARDRLDLPRNAFIVGHLGFITKPKQPAAVVGGFARLHEDVPDSLLLMVGADRTGGALDKLIRSLGVQDAVRMAGYVDLSPFYLYLKALDAMINLRYPSAGESSGTFSRALAEGRAVIVNNYGSFAEVPGDVALKVEIDADQAEGVGAHLIHLADDPVFRARTEARAR